MKTVQEQLADRIYELLPHKKELELISKEDFTNVVTTNYKPITLADLLLAISKNDILYNLQLKETGYIWFDFYGDTKYNLSQDNLLNQSDELCEFCLELLN